MTTTDTLLADLADVLDRASKLAARMAETLAGPPVDMLAPAYHPERDGMLGEVEPGDRVMWNGRWEECTATQSCTLDAESWHVSLGDWNVLCGRHSGTIRIQKRHGNTTIPDDPLREYRLPGGAVAYQEETVEHVMAGDWFQRRHGDTGWHQVERAPGSDSSICLQYRTPSGPTHEWFERGSKVRVATAPVPDPEPHR